jgi:hypothetical protein
MSLEHLPAREGDRAAYTIAEFCDAHRISRSKLYELWRQGKGPRVMDIDARRRISKEAAADWRRACEAASAREPVPVS